MSAADIPVQAVDQEEVRGLLAAGGMAWVAPVGEEETSPPVLPKYSPLSDPLGAERLAITLAARLRELRPNVVVVWEDVEDAILAHIVARELRVRAVRTWNADGLVAHSGSLPDKARALIVADAFRDAPPLLAMQAFVEQQGGTVVAAAAFVATKAVDEASAEIVALEVTTGERGAG